MLTVTVCVGSSCYVRGSETLAEALQRLIEQHNLDAQVEITGAFCMERCSMGVSVRVGERAFHGIDARDAETFFCREVLPCVAAASGAGSDR